MAVNTMTTENRINSTRYKEIIAAARKLFPAKGYEATSMNELIVSLGIAKGTMYYYFPSKQCLLEAVVEDIVDEEFTRLKNLLHSSTAQHLSPDEKLRLLLSEYSGNQDNNRILDILNRPDNSRMYSYQLGRYIEKLAPLYASIFAPGCGEGVFNSAYPLECAEFMIAGITFLVDPGLYPWSRSQITRRMKALPFLLEAQLGALSGFFDESLQNKNTNKE